MKQPAFNIDFYIGVFMEKNRSDIHVGLQLRQRLESMAEEGYRQFSSGLLPGTTNILGVRLPAMRALARELARGSWRDYIRWNGKKYFEEKMLHGMVLGYAKMDFEELLVYIRDFLPQIDNWSVCDSFCAGLKAFQKNRQRGWEFLLPLAGSRQEYEARFAFVMFLDHYVTELYVDALGKLAVGLKAQDYYAQMAAAWMLEKCYVNFPGAVEPILKQGRLNPFVHNKTISKICDSRAVAPEHKERLKKLRR